MSQLQDEAFGQIVETVSHLPEQYLVRITKETKSNLRKEFVKEFQSDIVSIILQLPEESQELIINRCKRTIAEDIAMGVCSILSGESERVARKVNNYIFNNYLQ